MKTIFIAFARLVSEPCISEGKDHQSTNLTITVKYGFMRLRVFVYGTLKRGFPLHKHLSSARFLGYGKLLGFEMYDLGWYPGIVPGKGEVFGEVYEIDLKTLMILDLIEDEGEEYERKLLPVTMEDGSTISAFVYVFKADVSNKRKVKDGLWRKKDSC